ncbi:hypothetical protein MMPV_005151 [Pyropia vietnamensis]
MAEEVAACLPRVIKPSPAASAAAAVAAAAVAAAAVPTTASASAAAVAAAVTAAAPHGWPENAATAALWRKVTSPFAWKDAALPTWMATAPTASTGAASVAMAAIIIVAISLLRYHTALRQVTPPGTPPLGSPFFPLPLLGVLPRLIRDPHTLWCRLSAAAAAHPTGAAAASLGGHRLLLLLTAPADVAAVVCRGGPAWAHTLHPNTATVFGKTNVAVVGGPAHVATRRALAAATSAASIARHTPVVVAAVGEALDAWAAALLPGGVAGALAGRERARELGLEVVESVWLGRPVYGRAPADRERLRQDVSAMAGGFTCQPLNLPGTALRRAVRSRERLAAALTARVGNALSDAAAAATAAAAAAATGAAAVAAVSEEASPPPTPSPPPPPSSMLDAWAASVVAGKPGAAIPPAVVADVLVDSLLAATDGLAAGVLGVLAHLAANPATVDAIRAEVVASAPTAAAAAAETAGAQGHCCPAGGSSSPIPPPLSLLTPSARGAATPAVTAAVAAALAAAPPAPFVPATAARATVLPSGLRVPAGTLVLPALGSPSGGGLPFGGGPHVCLGRALARAVLSAVARHAAVAVALVPLPPPPEGGCRGEVDYLPCAFPREATYVLRHWGKAAAAGTTSTVGTTGMAAETVCVAS